VDWADEKRMDDGLGKSHAISLEGLGLREKMSAVHHAGGRLTTKPVADCTPCHWPKGQ
jgi:hypothetical protein